MSNKGKEIPVEDQRVREVFDTIDTSSTPATNDKDAFESIGDHFVVREKQVDEFIKVTVENHKERWDIKRKFQIRITKILLAIVVIFFILLVVLISLTAAGVISSISSVIAVLSASGASFVASVFSLLTIIVKYIFPPKEEENSMAVLNTAVGIDYKYYIAKNNIPSDDKLNL